MSDEKKKYNIIAMTDQDGEYRRMLEEIAQWIHEKNPFDFQPSFRRKFRLQTKRGEVIKLAIDKLYEKMNDAQSRL